MLRCAKPGREWRASSYLPSKGYGKAMTQRPMRPLPMTAYIGGKKYSTAAATLIAHGSYAGGPVWPLKTR